MSLAVQYWKIQKKIEYADIFTSKRGKCSQKTQKNKLVPILYIKTSIFFKATERLTEGEPRKFVKCKVTRSLTQRKYTSPFPVIHKIKKL